MNEPRKAKEIPKVSDEAVTSVQFLADGNTVLANGRDSKMSVVDMRTLKVIRTFQETNNYSNFSNTNKAVLSPAGSMVFVPSTTGNIVAFDVSQGTEIGLLKPDSLHMFSAKQSDLNFSVLTTASTASSNPHLHRFVDVVCQPRQGKVAAISKSGYVTVWN
jgi:WD40 repeat protein